jgi:hypothetical protein
MAWQCPFHVYLGDNTLLSVMIAALQDGISQTGISEFALLSAKRELYCARKFLWNKLRGP